MVSGGVFICYRRDDSAGWTGRLYDRAAATLGSDRVFVDVEAIAPGEDFAEAIEEILDRVETVWVVIGPRWLEVRDGEGRRRIEDPADYVRQEIEGALGRDLRVVPVLVGGAEMPSEGELPSEIWPLARHNSVSLRDARFGADVELLLDGLKPGRPDRVPNTLPTLGTSFVGREEEQAEVKKLVLDARLVTITGFGGAGKTRLALQVANELEEEFPDGVWLVQLAALDDPELVDGTLMTALGLYEHPGKESREVLRDHLDGKSSLLVFDNCEHLVEPIASLTSDLLAYTSEVRFLATSRESIGVSGEVVFRVAPMPVPDSEISERSEAVGFDAVKLFEERGQLARPEFRVTDDNASLVVDICRRLDGVPLALELAAARLKTFTVKQILENLGEHFQIVTGRSRTALQRHRTLEATMDWSYRLLDEREQILFRRLAVFRGGFTLGAIRQVCTDNRIDPSSVLELLPSLVDKSLVVIDAYEDDAQYRLLGTVRHYASNKLEAEGLGASVREESRCLFRSNCRRRPQPSPRSRLDGPV